MTNSIIVSLYEVNNQGGGGGALPIFAPVNTGSWDGLLASLKPSNRLVSGISFVFIAIS